MELDRHNAWLARSPDLSTFLDLAYQNQYGEVWLYNNDLLMLRSPGSFEKLYKRKICGTLANNVDAIRILLDKDAENLLFSDPPDPELLGHFAQIAGMSDGEARLSTFYFGSMEGSVILPRATIPDWVRREIPRGDTWVFYTHDRFLEAPNAGVVMVRPTRFPFKGDEHRFAVVWLLQTEDVLQDRLRKAFQECFRTPSNFKWMKVLQKDPFKFELVAGESPETLRRRGQRAVAPRPPALLPGDRVDVAVIAALATEMREMEQLLPPVKPTPMGIDWYRYSVIERQRDNLTVLLATLNTMGGVAAAAITWDVIERWRPRFVILMGVAAGDPERATKGLNLGDVVVAEVVVPYEHEKLGEKGERKPRAPMPPATGRLFNAANRVATSLWPRTIQGRPDGDAIPSAVHIEAIATGSKLVESAEVWARLRTMHQKIVALEMEAEGVMFACSTHPHRPEALVVKAIMDYGTAGSRDEGKDKWKTYAATASAEFVADILKGDYL